MRNIVVRNNSQVPIYQQLYDQISSQIINGDLSADEVLPSIRVFAKELRVSIITVKKTWELLEFNNFIYTIKGKGSYVKENTSSDLNTKKSEIIKDALKEALQLCDAYDISKEELIKMIDKIYHK